MARTVSGDFVAVVLYHRDFVESVTAICRKYITKRLKNFVQSTESFYYESKQLDSNFFLVFSRQRFTRNSRGDSVWKIGEVSSKPRERRFRS